MNINVLDIALSFILLVLFVRGLRGGFWRAIFSFLALVISFCVATFYYDKVWDLLTHLLPTLPFSNLISFLAVVMAVYIAVRLVGASVIGLLNANYFGKWDKLLGGLVGLGKGIVVVSFLILTLVKFLPADYPMLQKCQLKSYCLPICRGASLITPSKFNKDLLQRICSPTATHKEAPPIPSKESDVR
jgi:membrane protein required for colicin V production